MISSSFPPLTLVALSGVFLKKAPNSNNWVPIIIGNSVNISNFSTCEESLVSEISIWNLLDLHQLLSYNMDDSVCQLLRFMCQCIWEESTGHYGQQLTIEELLENFRDLDFPDLNTRKSEKRQNIKLHIATRLREEVLNVIDQISQTEVKRSSDVIKHAFRNRIDNINQAHMEKYILKSMAYADQIRKILLFEFDLDVFFGKKAVLDNSHLIMRVIKLKEGTQPEHYECFDVIFEDEAKPVTTKANGILFLLSQCKLKNIQHQQIQLQSLRLAERPALAIQYASQAKCCPYWALLHLSFITFWTV